MINITKYPLEMKFTNAKIINDNFFIKVSFYLMGNYICGKEAVLIDDKNALKNYVDGLLDYYKAVVDVIPCTLTWSFDESSSILIKDDIESILINEETLQKEEISSSFKFKTLFTRILKIEKDIANMLKREK